MDLTIFYILNTRHKSNKDTRHWSEHESDSDASEKVDAQIM